MADKKIVTHFNPDLDAVVSVWLLKRWLPEWSNAEVEFVPAGKTYKGEEVDSDPDVLHVDTGLGKLDHHQTSEYTCAAKRTLEYVSNLIPSGKAFFSSANSAGSPFSPDNTPNRVAASQPRTCADSKNVSPSEIKSQSRHKEDLKWNKEALGRLVEVVNQVDHAQDTYWPEPEADYYELMIQKVLDGWKLLYREQDGLVVEKGLDLIDGIYVSFVSRIEAEDILEKDAVRFDTKWGKAVYYETKNNGVSDIAQRRGYRITVRKHPQLGHVRIKAMPDNQQKNTKTRKQKDTKTYEYKNTKT